MREIKFRAWDKKSKKMRMVDCLAFHGNGAFDIPTQGIKLVNVWGKNLLEDHIILSREPKEVELLSYTGLKDKNGTEIYEGDVVATEYSDRKFLVFYDIGRGGFSPFAMDDGCGCCSDELISIPEDCEVIGNKFEHPDLLNK